MADYKLIILFLVVASSSLFLFYYHINHPTVRNFFTIGCGVKSDQFKQNISRSPSLVLVGFDSPSRPVQLEDLHIDTLKYMFHGIVSSIEYVCPTKKQFGRTVPDGGYFVCMTGQIAPKPKACLVYSFGVNNEWSFDEALCMYGCEVHSFDPSMGMQDHVHPPGVNFHNLGLWESDFVHTNGWKFRSILSNKVQLKHIKTPIDVLKVDAEGAEWPVFRELSSFDLNVKQLIVEIHTPTVGKKAMTKRDVIEIIQSMINLKKKGFLLYYSHHKYHCCGAFSGLMPPEIPEQCCYELFYVNSNYI